MIWGVIGYGSIGKRHCQNITDSGDVVIVVTKSDQCPYEKVSDIESLFLKHNVDFVFISNETSKHFKTYQSIRKINKKIPILIEKPLFDKTEISISSDSEALVAYCLRFHPMIQELKKQISNDQIISARFYCGQYLPNWRPSVDYSQSYSAFKALGGGALRDLSHEIDLAQFLLGNLSLKYKYSEKISSLKIDSDDIFVGHFTNSQKSSVMIELNYLDRITQRNMTLISNNHTYRLDIMSGELNIDGEVKTIPDKEKNMYVEMITHFRNKNWKDFSTFKDGLSILAFFE